MDVDDKTLAALISIMNQVKEKMKAEEKVTVNDKKRRNESEQDNDKEHKKHKLVEEEKDINLPVHVFEYKHFINDVKVKASDVIDFDRAIDYYMIIKSDQSIPLPDVFFTDKKEILYYSCWLFDILGCDRFMSLLPKDANIKNYLSIERMRIHSILHRTDKLNDNGDYVRKMLYRSIEQSDFYSYKLVIEYYKKINRLRFRDKNNFNEFIRIMCKIFSTHRHSPGDVIKYIQEFVDNLECSKSKIREISFRYKCRDLIDHIINTNMK